MLTKFGFNGRFRHVISNCIASCGFSVLLRGAYKGFFRSTRGLRQGDPLSPFLFIIASEVLSRGLKEAFDSGKIGYFYTPRACSPISHLLYADDTLIFLNGRKSSILGCMEFLSRYCQSSGQKINASKSSFTLDDKAVAEKIVGFKTYTGFQFRATPLKYLGEPIFQGRVKISYFEDLIAKIQSRIQGGKAKLLSPGGRLTLIKHVLSSIPIYTLSTMCVPMKVLSRINSLLTDFFWGIVKED